MGRIELAVAPCCLVACYAFLSRTPMGRAHQRSLKVTASALCVLVTLVALVPARPPSSPPYQVIVHKAQRSLELLENGEPVMKCRVALGSAPVGLKEREGDLRTPEGAYYVCDKDTCDASRDVFHKWLGVSYPGADDALRGLAAGRLVWTEYWIVRLQILCHRKPFSHTWLGGNIGIHGGGSARDWTLGCVAADNRDIDALYSRIPIGTPVVILP